MEALKHSITKILPNGDKMIVDLRLGDIGLNKANGHADFAATGSIHEKKGKGWDREPCVCGCIHDEILEHAPELAPFVALHLSDQHGAPMYAVQNGFYYLTNDLSHDRKKRTRREVCQEHLRATDEEMSVLEKVVDVGQFALMISELGIPKRWAKEAKAATKQLEEWTGQTFAFIPRKSNFQQLSEEQKAEVLALVNSGYYDAEKVEQRKQQAEKERAEKMVARVKEDAAKGIKKIEDGLKVELFMIAQGYGEKFKWNWIYYDHTNSITFNPWGHVQAADDEVIQRTKEAAQAHAEELPEGLKVDAKG